MQVRADRVVPEHPTQVSTAEIAFVMIFAISHPTTRIIRNTANFGTNVATFDQALDTPVP
jgi:hypothetical protein